MKTITILCGGMVLCAVAGSAAPSVTTGDLLKIGSGHVLVETFGGNTTYNSIAGGANNTNSSGAASIIGGGVGNIVTTNVYWSTIAGGVENVAKAIDATIGGGYRNKILTTNGLPSNLFGDQNSSEHSVVAGGSYNIVFPSISVISGGGGNMIEPYGNHSVISGGRSNLIGYASGYSTISGGDKNKIVGGAQWAAINGGLENEIEYIEDITTNQASAGLPIHGGWIGGGLKNYIRSDRSFYGSIGGGFTNLIQGYISTIAGGQANRIDGDWGAVPGGAENFIETNSLFSAIGGGWLNKVQKSAEYSVIGGGQQNKIGTNSSISTIGGGQFNKIANDAYLSTIPGGYANEVTAPYSFAAGSYAKAAHQGALVLSDKSVDSAFSSTNDHEFAVRAHGGVRFQTGGMPTGMKLSPGSGTWASLCDRNAKANFAPVNGRTVLEKVAALPLQTWNYKDQGENIRHIGPVAQDFHAAFGVGDDDRTITTVDADGVALAAIQGLHDLVKEKDSALKEQQKTVNELSARLQALEKILLNQVSAK